MNSLGSLVSLFPSIMAAPSSKDVALLAALGYRQEFRRQFSILETFGVAFSIIGLVPSIAFVLHPIYLECFALINSHEIF